MTLPESEFEGMLYFGVYSIDVLLILFMVPYTIWNWHTALTGRTNVEIAKGIYKDREGREKSKDDIDEIREQHYD